MARPGARKRVRAAPTAGPLPDERALAAAAHASVAFGLLGIGFLVGLLVTLVIWLRGHRSRYVAVHAEQAGWYQLFVVVSNVLIGAAWLVSTVVLFGQLLGFPGLLGLPSWNAGLPALLVVGLILALVLPLWVVWFVGTIAYGIYGSMLAMTGQPFWYPVIGPWVRRRLGEPLPAPVGELDSASHTD